MLQHGSIRALAVTHYSMEMAVAVRHAFHQIQPDCVAVELPEPFQKLILQGIGRLPDLSVVCCDGPLYLMIEPCDPLVEGLRSALEAEIPAYCIDLDVKEYPEVYEPLPDPYSITRIGLEQYYDAYRKLKKTSHPLDQERELHMARRLKELSLSHERILFISGMAHTENVLHLLDNDKFPNQTHTNRTQISLATLTEESAREVMAECGYLTLAYERWRTSPESAGPDRQKGLYSLYKQAAPLYEKESGLTFCSYHLRNLMKFVRNYALTKGRLMPDLYQLLSAAKGCVDHNYAYEVWELATAYPPLRNIDNLPKLSLTVEEVWGQTKVIRFHRKKRSRKQSRFEKRKKVQPEHRFAPSGSYSICSHQPEDIVVETFGDFLRKKGKQILADASARTVPFMTSLEDGIDTRETIRHWHEKKLYVKLKGHTKGGVGSIVVIFDEDNPEEDQVFKETYPWRTTWHGEHEQESDMSFYATRLGENVVGPGICRCTYGGFLMTYPPRRVYDIWSDPDYSECRTKSEALLMAAIDYAVEPAVVYVAAKPPRRIFKSFASRFGKKVVYFPLGQLSPVLLDRIRHFHVLDSYGRREMVDDYIR
jgi:hypothetical protein